MLADIPDTSRFDSEWEFESVSTVLAVLFFHPIGAPSPKRLQEYIERSQSNRVHYDALKRIEKELDKLSKATPRRLSRWSLGDADGLPQRPPGRNLPPYRPANPATLMRNVHMLHCDGKLRAGEDVLVMAAGSGTGSSGFNWRRRLELGSSPPSARTR